MIFSDLMLACKARLDSDAYFTHSPGVAILVEDQLDLLTEIEKALKKQTVVGLIAIEDIGPGESRNKVEVRLSVTFQENVGRNRAATGTGKPAMRLAVKAMAMFFNWTPEEGIWAPLRFDGLSDVTPKEAAMGVLWQLRLKTSILLDVLISILGTEAAAELVTSSGESMLVSPTEP